MSYPLTYFFYLWLHLSKCNHNKQEKSSNDLSIFVRGKKKRKNSSPGVEGRGCYEDGCVDAAMYM